MKKFLKVWRSWIATRPILSVLIASAYGLGIGIIAGGNHSDAWFAGLAAITVLLIGTLAFADRKKFAAFALTIVMATSSINAEEQVIRPAGGVVIIGVGLGLIVGGGYICYRAAKACHKVVVNPPPPRNTNDGSLFLLNAEPDSYSAGSYFWETDYCSMRSDLNPNLDTSAYHGVNLTVEFGYGHEPEVSIQHFNGSEMEYGNGLRGYGLDPSKITGGSTQYVIDGRPVSSAAVPFTISANPFDPLVTVYPDRPQRRFTVDVSTDGTTYHRLAHVSIPAGEKFILQDVSDTAMALYRVTVED